MAPKRSRKSRRGTSGPKRTRAASKTPERPPKRVREELSDRDDSRAERGKMLGEGIEGRSNVTSDLTFRENNRALREHKDKKHATQLQPVNVELHAEENREDHKTDGYEMQDLIIRRGQEFKISVTFDRSYDSKRDQIFLQFVTGQRPQESKKTLIRVEVGQELTTSKWGMQITEIRENKVKFSVMSPADAVVGEYRLFVETKTKVKSNEKESSFRMEVSEPIYILFNAWCEDDAVFMADEAQREEYVLNDRGRIWVGCARRFTGIPWNFGQFEDVVLTTCLYLLDKAKVAASARANPVRVTRVISQMANYNDQDGGILYGRWTETYPKNSTKPTAWTGSVAICEKFARNHNVVRYGQCWVFSGLVTTLLRALGIPTRSVTNFESAHDSDASMTIDFHHDEKGEPLTDLNDSVWNFHVWNESYFTRPDLPDGYDGWQAHDATPQETSEGIFRCGPCPVKAIKSGDVYIPYDAGFIFAEVNGDRVYWDVDEEGEMKATYIDKKSIGKFISTKAVGSNYREDLTNEYKFPEGSPEERKAAHRANKFSSRKDENIYGLPDKKDVAFHVEVNESVPIGDDIKIKLWMKNDSKEVRKVESAITIKAAFYTGIVSKDVKEPRRERVTLKGGQEKEITVRIMATEYHKLLASDVCIKTFFKCKVLETNQSFAIMETLEFEKPELEAYLSAEDIKKNEKFEMTFQFTNPLPMKLTNGIFHIECSRMEPKTIEKQIKGSVGPNKQASVTVTLKSKRRGNRHVEASFQCDQISGIRGEFIAEIK